MNSKKKVSIAVVRRLPRYYRYLSDLLELDITRISSKELSARMGITASQIRQDLNCFGGFGQQGYGYNVESLFNEIGNILGLNNKFQMIIIGAGHMGQALANYSNFEKRGYKLVGIFDVDPGLIGKKIKNIEIEHYDKLEEFVKHHRVDVAILSVPYDRTRMVADKVASLGIKGLWNFSPMDLKIPYDVVIENVHLSDSLMVLGYRLNEKFKCKKNK
ncbi:MAG: redox-sensing transcriptional repressor Rex [Clostridiales bacterium]|nr:redox-sensing transcriptional repressor Rex [Eubacteriales bacterium]MDH7566995.1 redox-sensing transcriptional repressor Rex [Clostridiales bacterium]